MMMNRRNFMALGLSAGGVAACTPAPSTQGDDLVAALANEIGMLGPDVDTSEARRVAEITYTYSAQLTEEYDITTSPILHNTLVNTGVKERGLCNHWAEDIHRRLVQERFRTLVPLRAISPQTTFRIIHHSAVIAPTGGTIYDGVILDPWRYGGTPFWGRTVEDTRYNWRPREEVLAELIAARDAREDDAN